MYAKYHGGLIIILAILPHLRLFKSIHFYIATVIGLALYLPHIIWQIEHDFISFKFHLFDRADSVFKIKNVVNYILASILVLNPLLLFLLFWKKTKHLAFKNLPKHYAYLFFGGLLFFFLSSFRDKIEPHWVFFTVIPLILFSFQVIIHLEDKISLIKKGLFFFIILIFGFRIIAILPLNTNLEFHKEGASYFETVQNKAKDLPVAYVNSYQNAAKHTFYTGNTAFSSNNYFYRKNQYDLWNYEDSIHNKEILLVGNYPHDFFDSIFVENEDPILVSKVAKFPMINKLHSEIKSIKPIKGNEYEITFSITNPYTYTVNFQDAEMPLDFKIAFNKNGERESSSPITVTIDKIAPKQTLNLKGRFSPAITLDDHLYSLNIRRGHLYYVRISDFQKMDLE